MLVTDDQKVIPHILFAPGQAIGAHSIESHLKNAAYHVTTTTQPESFTHFFENLTIDAIVAVATETTLPLLYDLRQAYSEVLIVLIVPEEAEMLIDDYTLSIIDMVVPPHPMYLDRQLQTLLHLHIENKYLQNHLHQLEAEVQEQQRMTGEMEILKNAIVRNVSHELRTPLLQVKSAVSLIAEDFDDEKLISYAKDATARLETHVKNITMLGNSLDIRPSPIILRDAIEYAKRNLGRVWQRKDELDRIQLQIETNLPPIYADKQGLSTVLQLLIDNALKFSNDHIIIIAEQHLHNVRIQVQDNGIGIAEDQLLDIFDTFYQVDSSSTRRYGGAGVGLAIVKLILDNHDTTIQVESVIGEGSTFWFELPIVDIFQL